MKFKITEITKTSNVKNIVSLYKYNRRNKIVTFVPLSFVDKLMFELGNAGAGVIGTYDLCSFRMKGLGTYRPKINSKPFKGNLYKISYEEEVRLEMEFSPTDTDKVVDALLTNHPYEEPAYEIYEFTKRNKIPSGFVFYLKKNIPVKTLLKKLVYKLEDKSIDCNDSFKSLAIIEDENTVESCRIASLHCSEYLLAILKSKKLLIKI